MCTHIKMLRVHVSGMCCSDLLHVAGTKSSPKLTQWCCTIINASVHTRGQHIPETCTRTIFMCEHMLWFCPCYMSRYPSLLHVPLPVPATCSRYTSLLHVASECTTHVFCRCKMSLQHDPSCLSTFTVQLSYQTLRMLKVGTHGRTSPCD